MALVLVGALLLLPTAGRWLLLSLPLAPKPKTLEQATPPSALGGFEMSLVVHLSLLRRPAKEAWIDLVVFWVEP